jgi:DNA-binding IclR family transcriptional regulator
MATLVNFGYATQDPKTRQYRPGVRFIVTASRMLSGLELVTVARPVMERLIQQFNETTHLAILHDGESLDLLSIESTHHVRVCNSPGGYFPIHCSSTGKVLLAHISDAEVEEIVHLKGMKRYTPHTITSLERLKDELATIREQGYGVDDGEYEVHTWCAASPVRDRSQSVIAALGVSGLMWRLNPSLKEEIIKGVVATAGEISSQLGFHSTSPHGFV